MRENTAAWLASKHARLSVSAAPYSSPRRNEIVVMNRAVAINPIDWIIQSVGDVIFRWIRYPFVLGSDLAGDVVEVGADVTRFAVGDRVLAHAVGTDADRNSAAEGSFQRYTVVLERMTSPIPDSLGYQDAAVLPLALSTAACGLFQQDHLALQHPTAVPEPTGETVLVWGGSTSVGSNAIQLAVAAGYEVITTASPHNFGYVTELGASEVFDHNDPNVTDRIVAAFTGRTLAGALAIGTGSAAQCAAVVRAGTGRKFVSTASQSVSFDAVGAGESMRLIRLLLRLVASDIALQAKLRHWGIRSKAIFGSSLMNNEVSRAIYTEFLPRALAEGRYIAAPEPRIVGIGLESLQEALDAQRQGVSARKIVVTLDGPPTLTGISIHQESA